MTVDARRQAHVKSEHLLVRPNTKAICLKDLQLKNQLL
jgi:hypothetical protein